MYCKSKHTLTNKHTFLTSELLGSVVQVMIRDTANLVSLEFTKSPGSICCARVSMYLRIATLTCKEKESQRDDKNTVLQAQACSQ